MRLGNLENLWHKIFAAWCAATLISVCLGKRIPWWIMALNFAVSIYGMIDSYVRLKKTEKKLKELLEDYENL